MKHLSLLTLHGIDRMSMLVTLSGHIVMWCRPDFPLEKTEPGSNFLMKAKCFHRSAHLCRRADCGYG